MDWVAAISLTLPSLLWGQIVNYKLPEPYLDEVFHIPQAQKYCRGDWSWDPKITTPPGLYSIAAAFKWIIGCSTPILRAENGIILWLLIRTVRGILKQRHAVVDRQGTSKTKRLNHYLHNAVNIALFPPLFFFSGLYYTDVGSTYATLVFWQNWIEGESSNRVVSGVDNISLCLLGLHSLLYRQTNIFWVAIFPLAISLLHKIDHGPTIVKQSLLSHAAGFGDTWANIIRTSWKMGVVYDRPVADAFADDYLMCIVSMFVCTISASTDLSRFQLILNRTTPGLVLLAVFIAFVYLNGSVVLGDKSNHVATIHLPQMLYIWPYFFFFSWPLVLPHIMSWLLGILDRIQQPGGIKIRTSDFQTLLLVSTSTLLTAVVIRYNTIIHPFTLADNRHYTFYVFRLLMRPWWMRYAVIPVYLASAWSCIQGLGNGFKKVSLPAKQQNKVTTQTRAPTVSVSFVMIWLVTSALPLVTAPLVEPRYFILPWVFWRLHVPVQTNNDFEITFLNQESGGIASYLQQAMLFVARYRLWIETAWLITINVATGYIFLQWTFTWPNEPGKLQRFMW